MNRQSLLELFHVFQLVYYFTVMDEIVVNRAKVPITRDIMDTASTFPTPPSRLDSEAINMKTKIEAAGQQLEDSSKITAEDDSDSRNEITKTHGVRNTDSKGSSYKSHSNTPDRKNDHHHTPDIWGKPLARATKLGQAGNNQQ